MKLKHYFFSLLLVYYFLHIFGFIFGFIFEPLVFFIGEHIFKIDYTFEVNGYGSGDNTYSYLASFCNLLVAVVVAFPVTFLLNKTKNIQVVQNYFFVLLRIYLIFFMLIYGLSKVFPMQFPPIGLQRLEQTYGDSSPMGLAWSFMQYSQTYTAFAGFSEVLGALLLLSSRTLLLGALILTGVLTNVVMMNFCYDIPVKLSSSHMLLAALIILSSDLKRILNFFILNKETQPSIHHNGFENGEEPKSFFLSKVALKAFFAIGIITYFTIQYFSYKDEMERKPLLYGIYEVVPSEKNTADYRSFIFDRYDTGVITDTNNKKNVYSYKVDAKTKTVTFNGSRDTTAVKQVFKYQKTKNELILTTTSAKKIHLKEKKGDAILLTHRGFNWINEYPYNR